MPKPPRSHVDDLRGTTRLAIEATRGVTSLVEAMHVAIASGPAILGSPLAGPAKLATGLVYGTIRGVTQLVGVGIEQALAQLGPLLGASRAGSEREIVLAVLNGVLGDYLAAQANPLALPMALRHDESASGKLVVLVHGLCMADRQWLRAGHDHGAALARDLGYAPIYASYNSGLHISTNGRALAAALDGLVATWPVPVDEIVLLCHSMGGLVARSACEIGGSWRGALRSIVMLGSPHHGAPLERGGNWIDLLLGVSRYSAPFSRLARLRSAGITDLRYGYVRDADWEGRDRFAHGGDEREPLPLPAGIACFALAGTLAGTGGLRASDGMVPVDSALGRHRDATHALQFTETSIASATGHIDLLGAGVYPTILGWLARGSGASVAAG